MRHAFRVTHQFELRLRVGTKLTALTAPVTVHDLLPFFLTSPDQKQSLLGNIQPEEIRRADANVGMIKTISGKRRAIWVGATSPFNVHRRDLTLNLDLRTGTSEGGDRMDDSDM